MGFFKKFIGIIVGKIAFRAQLIPMGELRGLKWLWGHLFYTSAQRAKLNALWDEFIEQNQNHKKNGHQEKYVEAKRELLPTSQGVFLDTAEISAKGENANEYVIYGWGRSDCYENYLPRLASDALNLNKKLITFNFRGVARSKGQVYSEQDLIDDYIFQVKRLIRQGVPAHAIRCYGHSLCGAIATKAVAKLHKQSYRVKLYNDRSFASLIDTSTALYFSRKHSRARIVNAGALTTLFLSLPLVMVLAELSFITTAVLGIFLTASIFFKPTHLLYDKLFAPLLQKGMQASMVYGNWGLNTVNDYESIAPEYRCHTLIREPNKKVSKTLGEKNVKLPAQDRVIPYEYSMHKHLNGERKLKKDLKEQLIKAKSKKEKVRIKSVLIKMGNSNMTGGGHMSDPKELVTWYKSTQAKRPLTGQEHLYDFIEPQGKHTEPQPRKYKIFS